VKLEKTAADWKCLLPRKKFVRRVQVNVIDNVDSVAISHYNHSLVHYQHYAIYFNAFNSILSTFIDIRTSISFPVFRIF